MNANMQKLFDSLRDCVVIANDEGQVKYANRVAQKMLSIHSGQPLPGDSIRLQLKAARQGYLKLPITLEVDAPGQGGEADHLRVTILESPVGNDYVIVLHNLTEAQFYENTTRNLAELLNHEFRTPLQDLSVALDKLLMQLPIAQDAGKDAVPGMTQADRLQAISSTLIEVGSRLDHHLEQLLMFGETFGHAPMRSSERLTIPDLVSRVLLKVRAYLQPRHIRVSLVGVSESLPIIYGSMTWLSQALAEIIRGLGEHAKDGAEILLSVKASGNFVMFQVEDRGCGIPSHLRERAFLPFYRGEQSPSGLGLGMALCKQIVELHGGHVRFVDAGDDMSGFIVEVPVGSTTVRSEEEVGLLQAQRYAQDLARLMQRAAGAVN